MQSRAHIGSHPIHPMLVALPIGMWIPSLILDLLGRSTGQSLYWSAGFLTVIGGCIGAALAAVPGVIDWWSVVPPKSSAKTRGAIHGGLNVLVLIIFVAVAARRGNPSTMPDNLSLVMSAIATMVLGVSGWLGGTLAYRNQIGVARSYANAGGLKERTLSGWDKPACNQSELGDGQLMLVKIEDTRVAIGKCAEGLFAFNDQCTHRGGPLSDGALVGCTVQCPWHGSQFDVRTGRVVASPANDKIETYEITVRGGEVYLTRPATDPIKKVA